MSERYGQRWEMSFGELKENGKLTSTAKTWAKALGHLSLEQISQGFAADLKRADDWPPTMPKFVAMCEGADKLWEHRRYEKAAKAPAPALTYRPDAEEARKKLQEIREMLTGNRDKALISIDK